MSHSLKFRVAIPTALVIAQIALAGSIASAFPSTVSAQLLRIDAVCTVLSPCAGPTNRMAIRRGLTETVSVIGPFVDQANLSGVTTSNSSVIPRSATPGQNCGTSGPCLRVSLEVPAAFSLTNRIVTVFVRTAVGASAFNVHIVRRGAVGALTQTPAEPIWGEPVRVSIAGTDIGNTSAVVGNSTVSNHVEAAESGAGTTTFTVVASGASRTSTDVALGDDAVSGISYSPRKTIRYRAQTAEPPCATTPNIGAPSLISPANGQMFTFTTNPVNATITLSWGAGYQGQFKATEQFILEIGQAIADAGTRGTAGTATTYTNTRLFLPQTHTLAAGVMVKVLSLPRNIQYQWRVKAVNCGTNGPFSAYSRFTVR